MRAKTFSSLLLVFAIAFSSVPAWAKEPWKKNLEAALAARYPLAKQNAKKILGVRFTAGSDIQELGTILAVNIEGIIAEPTNTGHSTYWVTNVEDGKVQQSGGGVLGGLTGNSVRVGRRSLRVRESVSRRWSSPSIATRCR